MSAEARYERLLRLYPRAHRDEYGPEMLATLMESSTAERRHPEWRESLELILGGLRARAGRPTPASALRLAVLLLLAHATALLGAHAGRTVFSEVLPGRGMALPSNAGYVTGFAAAALALVLVAAGRYRLGALLMVAALVSQQWADSWILWMAQATGGEFWQLPLALLLMLPLLALRPAACRRPWLWLAAVPLALVLLPTAFDASLGLQPFTLLAVAVGCLAWSVVDARAAIAGGALMLVQLLSQVSFHLLAGWSFDASWNMAAVLTYGGSAVVLIGVGAILVGRARRT